MCVRKDAASTARGICPAQRGTFAPCAGDAVLLQSTDMKYPPWLVAAVIAVAVVLVLMLERSLSSPCRASSALRLEGLCGAASYYAGSR